MPSTKTRHLHPVPDPAPRTADVVSLARAAEVLAERRATFARHHKQARAAADMPDAAKERAELVRRTAYRLGQPGADVTGLLAELATAMFVLGYMNDSDRDQLAGATLATITWLEEIERKYWTGDEPA